jgi:hypothetical protein
VSVSRGFGPDINGRDDKLEQVSLKWPNKTQADTTHSSMIRKCSSIRAAARRLASPTGSSKADTTTSNSSSPCACVHFFSLLLRTFEGVLRSWYKYLCSSASSPPSFSRCPTTLVNILKALTLRASMAPPKADNPCPPPPPVSIVKQAAWSIRELES